MKVTNIVFSAGYVTVYRDTGPPTRYPIRDFLEDAIDSEDFVDGSIDTEHLADGAVTTAKIAADTVIAADIAAGGVGTSELATGAVTSIKIGSKQVVEASLGDGSITEVKIATGAVAADKIGASAITRTKIATGEVRSAAIGSKQVVEAGLGDGSVTEIKLATGAVATDKIAADAINRDKIADGEIRNAAIGAGQVVEAGLGGGSVTTSKLATDAVTSPKIGDLTEDLVFSSARATGMIRDAAQVFYVDIGRTTSLETGSADSPYKTIMGAVNAIITLANNTDLLTYTIYIAPGIYTETVTLENAELVNISFISLGGPASAGYIVGTGGVILDPESGNALESEGTNTALRHLYFYGIYFKGHIILDGVDNATYFGEKGIVFESCGLDDGNTALTLSVKDCERFTWRNCFMNRKSVLTVENVWSFEICGEGNTDWPMNMSGASTLTADTGQACPYHMLDANGGGDQMSFKIDHAFSQRSNWTMAQGGTGVLMVQCINGFWYASFTMPTLGTVTGYTGIFNADVTMNATGTISLYNTVIKGTLTENGCAKNVYASET